MAQTVTAGGLSPQPLHHRDSTRFPSRGTQAAGGNWSLGSPAPQGRFSVLLAAQISAAIVLRSRAVPTETAYYSNIPKIISFRLDRSPA